MPSVALCNVQIADLTFTGAWPMITVSITTQPEEVRHLLPWAMMLADSRGSELAVLKLRSLQ
jgi:hypothetical protein